MRSERAGTGPLLLKRAEGGAQPLEQVDGLVHWDLVYRREATTPWVAHALQRGQFAVDGRLMLARQAVEAQRFWGYPVEDAAAVYRRWCGESRMRHGV